MTPRIGHHAFSGGAGPRQPLLVRALRPQDTVHLADLFDRLSPESRYLRYLTPLPALPESFLRHLSTIDHDVHEAVGAFDGSTLVGVAHYFRAVDDPFEAEVSVEVADSHQRRGIGSWLLAELAGLAIPRGVRTLTATALAENRGVVALLRRSPWPACVRSEGPELVVHLELPRLGASASLPATA